VSPRLHHCATLLEEFGPVVCATERSALHVRELSFDYVGRHIQPFDNQRAGTRSEAVRAMDILCVPESAKRHIDRVLAHAATLPLETREYVLAVTRERPDLLQKARGLTRKRDHMGSAVIFSIAAALHLDGRDRPSGE